MTTSEIRKLAQAEGPCITIVIAGREGNELNTEMRNAVSVLRRELLERGTDPEPLLGTLGDSVRDMAAATKGRGSLVILRSPGASLTVRVPGAASIVKVGERFDIRTLLAIAGSQVHFYLLAISQKRMRLLECTQESSQELPFPAGFATNLGDFKQTRKPDHVLDNRSAGGPSTGSMKGVMFGTSSDSEDKDEYLLHFMSEINKAVNTALKGRNDPLVPAGVAGELAMYARVNTYPLLVEPGVHGAPDGLEGGEMHRRALELLHQKEQEGVPELADFDKKVGTGHASAGIHEIVPAAHEGRISHLFLQANAHYEGTFDAVKQHVKHTTDPLDSPVDLIDSAALETILHGGEARILPGPSMPNGVPVCAIFRYEAPRVQDASASVLTA